MAQCNHLTLRLGSTGADFECRLPLRIAPGVRALTVELVGYCS